MPLSKAIPDPTQPHQRQLQRKKGYHRAQHWHTIQSQSQSQSQSQTQTTDPQVQQDQSNNEVPDTINLGSADSVDQQHREQQARKAIKQVRITQPQGVLQERQSTKDGSFTLGSPESVTQQLRAQALAGNTLINQSFQFHICYNIFLLLLF
jgi:G:T/U-mismatch repair DNA glycosylase